MNTFELNNIRKDSDNYNGKITPKSPVVEIFSAMVQGKDLSTFGAKADTAVKYIKDLGDKAQNGDWSAVAELNTLRKFTIEPKLLEEIRLLGVFGTYTPLGFDETPEAETYQHVGQKSRTQAANGDVTFPMIVKETYQVASHTISGGYANDYRRVAIGDMSKENEGLEQVKIDIRNNAALAVVEKVFTAIETTTGVKFFFEAAGMTKAGADGVIAKVRRFGKPNVVGDYSLISQFTPWAGYVGTIGASTITGVSQKLLDEIAQNGILGSYNGAILSEMPNPYDLTSPNSDKTGFDTYLPAGLGFVIPTGGKSPIRMWSRGGLTSLTGNDVSTGKIITRFDLEWAVDVAKGLEYTIGILHDSSLDSL